MKPYRDNLVKVWFRFVACEAKLQTFCNSSMVGWRVMSKHKTMTGQQTRHSGFGYRDSNLVFILRIKSWCCSQDSFNLVGTICIVFLRYVFHFVTQYRGYTKPRHVLSCVMLSRMSSLRLTKSASTNCLYRTRFLAISSPDPKCDLMMPRLPLLYGPRCSMQLELNWCLIYAVYAPASSISGILFL